MNITYKCHTLMIHACMLFFMLLMNTYGRERGLRPALNLGMWHYGAELVHSYMSTYARGQSLRHNVV